MKEAKTEGLGAEGLRDTITSLLAHVWEARDPEELKKSIIAVLAHVWEARDPEGKTSGIVLDSVRTWLLSILRPALSAVPSRGMPVDFVAAQLGQVIYIYKDAVRYWPPANMPRSYCHGGSEPELVLIDSMPVEALADLFKFLRIRPAREGDDE